MNKNLSLLILSQIFAFTAAPVTVFLSGIIGSKFSPIKSLATLPMALSVVGIALFALFAAKLMSIIGRKLGFIYASIGTCFASLLTAYSIIIESFILYNLGCFLIGGGIAFSHQYRFAAVEVVDKDYAPKAISIILLAGIGSAFIGPNIANISKGFITDHMYAGLGVSDGGFWLFGSTGNFIDLGNRSVDIDNILYGIQDKHYPYWKHLNNVTIPKPVSTSSTVTTSTAGTGGEGDRKSVV